VVLKVYRGRFRALHVNIVRVETVEGGLLIFEEESSLVVSPEDGLSARSWWVDIDCFGHVTIRVVRFLDVGQIHFDESLGFVVVKDIIRCWSESHWAILDREHRLWQIKQLNWVIILEIIRLSVSVDY